MFGIGFSSISTGYVGFSFLLHSGLLLCLAILPNWREVPVGATGGAEVSIVSKTPSKSKAISLKKAVKAKKKARSKKAAVRKKAARKARSKKVAVRKKAARKARSKKVARKVRSSSLRRLPEKKKTKPTLKPKVQKTLPVVVAQQDFPPPSSHSNQKFDQRDQADQIDQRDQDNQGAVAAVNDLTEEIDQEVEELESVEAAEVAADLAAVSHSFDESSSQQPSTSQLHHQQPSGELLLGIPDGARLNTDLRQRPGNIPPVYPAVARQNAWEGTVALSYHVTSEGHVEGIKVLRSSGYHILDQEAVRAIRHYRYLPGQQGKTYHPVAFRLTGPVQQSPPSRLRAAHTSYFSGR